MFGSMSGWKSKVSGVGQMLGGVSLAISGLVSEPMDFTQVAAGWAMFADPSSWR